MLANSNSVKDFIDSLKQCKQCLQKMGSPVFNWILSSTLLHNLRDVYKRFVSSMFQLFEALSLTLTPSFSSSLTKNDNEQTSVRLQRYL